MLGCRQTRIFKEWIFAAVFVAELCSDLMNRIISDDHGHGG